MGLNLKCRGKDLVGQPLTRVLINRAISTPATVMVDIPTRTQVDPATTTPAVVTDFTIVDPRKLKRLMVRPILVTTTTTKERATPVIRNKSPKCCRMKDRV